jgi:hypothetical protein
MFVAQCVRMALYGQVIRAVSIATESPLRVLVKRLTPSPVVTLQRLAAHVFNCAFTMATELGGELGRLIITVPTKGLSVTLGEIRKAMQDEADDWAAMCPGRSITPKLVAVEIQGDAAKVTLEAPAAEIRDTHE